MKRNAWKWLAAAGAMGIAFGAAADKHAATGDKSMMDKGKQAQMDKSKDMQKSKDTQKSKDAGMAAAPALVIVPTMVAVDPNFNKGCWARFYADQNFEGDVLALSGPVQLADMDTAQPFWGEADSAIIGPKARVTTYDNEEMNDQTAVLNSNQRISNLRDRLGWFEGIESVKVECTGN